MAKNDDILINQSTRYSGVGFQLRILHAVPTLVCCLFEVVSLLKTSIYSNNKNGSVVNKQQIRTRK